MQAELMHNLSSAKAVIYVRTARTPSSTEDQQAVAQLIRCKKNADLHNYDILAVFRDEGKAAGSKGCSGLQAMFAYLRNNRDDDCIKVVATDPSRLSREITLYHQLINKMVKLNAMPDYVEPLPDMADFVFTGNNSMRGGTHAIFS